MKEQRCGFVKARSLSNGSPLAISCGYTENVRLSQLSRRRYLTLLLAGSGKSVLWFVLPCLSHVSVKTQFSPVPP